eukprot:CAMPEP_0197315098 /NCGR_PEP_ID=MMETSP0891-20130614/36712_1 /TAXON_ID=44058 ORGANISM="Aureoumbra lagunensis, Strain CCMP1510" /NCGR_SAMPLE_ID=MMETSP0891 /ASSEMBLY_ACC=CAM_ASM_000534 /LENGTH=292 /DNA_ID=CAMNT_0042803885 /DNA_START=225 /DNA_END=1104 /DNA_ORIENTATION=-
MRSVGRPQFFLRIAELCDSANGERRQQLEALADNLSATLSAVAERTESRLEDASQRLAQIISAAAEEDSGEFLVPLSDTKLKALRTSVENALTKNQLDEAVLSTVHASTKKAQEDGLDGVVAILRKLLQLYAASTLNFIIQPPNSSEQAQNNTQPNSSFHPDYQAAIDCYSELMASDADKHWDSILQRNLKGDPPKVGKNQLLAVVQAQIEQTVLLQENGSFAQRVQAEFLREIVARIETILPTTPDDLDKQDSNDLLNAFLDQTSVKSEKTSTNALAEESIFDNGKDSTSK